MLGPARAVAVGVDAVGEAECFRGGLDTDVDAATGTAVSTSVATLGRTLQERGFRVVVGVAVLEAGGVSRGVRDALGLGAALPVHHCTLLQLWRRAVALQKLISETCPEALMRLSAMAFYKMRSRDYHTSA